MRRYNVAGMNEWQRAKVRRCMFTPGSPTNRQISGFRTYQPDFLMGKSRRSVWAKLDCSFLVGRLVDPGLTAPAFSVGT